MFKLYIVMRCSVLFDKWMRLLYVTRAETVDVAREG